MKSLSRLFVLIAAIILLPLDAIATRTPIDHAKRNVIVEVTAENFPHMKEQVALGRKFIARDFDSNSSQVALLSHDVWRSKFDGETGVIGQQIRLHGVETIIVGVLERTKDAKLERTIWVAKKS